MIPGPTTAGGVVATLVATAVPLASGWVLVLRRSYVLLVLEPVESERMLRIERFLALAIEMLRDVARARGWPKSPKTALAGQRPLDYADTEVGAREVEQLIGRLRHGVFS